MSLRTSVRKLVTDDLREYCEALSDPWCIPLLQTAQSPSRMPLPEPAAPSGGVAGLLVVSPEDSQAQCVANSLAERLGGERAVIEPGKALDTSGYRQVVVLALAGELNVSMVIGLVDATRTADGLGFVTAGDLGSLSWMLAKGLTLADRPPPDEAHVMLAPFTPTSESGLEALTLSGAEVTRQSVVKAVVDTRCAFLSLTTAGREHAAILNDTVLCGSDPEERARWRERGGGPAPHCAFTGDCFISGVSAADVITAESLRADIVFLNSCLSWRPHAGLAPREFLLVNGLSRGEAAGVIGTVFPSHATDWAVTTFHRAGDSGVPLGKIVSMLNERAGSTAQEMPYFVLLGLPWITNSVSKGPSYESVHEAVEVRPGVVGEVQAPPAVYLRALLDMGFSSSGLRAAVKSLEQQQGRPDLLRRAEEEAVAELIDYSSATHSGFDAIWDASLETVVRASEKCCCYCGSVVSEVLGSHPRIPALGRVSGLCPICGPVWDLPVRSRLAVPELELPAIWQGGERVRVKTRLRPGAGGWPVESVVVGLFIHGMYFQGIDGASTEVVKVGLGGVKEISLAWDLDVREDAFAHHQQFARVVVVADGVIHLGGRRFAVVPHRGRVS